jgi:hypothetical protein
MAEPAEVKVSDEAPKQRFLVVYDYGQGGIWAFIWARSAEDIDKKFRGLKVVDTMPSWLTGDELVATEQTMTYDIDNLKPGDWIPRMLRPGWGRAQVVPRQHRSGVEGHGRFVLLASHHREEHAQVVGVTPHGVRTGSTHHELQELID